MSDHAAERAGHQPSDDEPEAESPITLGGLSTGLCDDFHDWIDGDDWPTSYFQRFVSDGRAVIDVTFRSGKRFEITIKDMTDEPNE